MYHGLYLHIPFCTHRCGYCDFNTYDDRDDLIADYSHALMTEIRRHKGHAISGGLKSLFFGGGTPSLLSEAEVKALITEARISLGFREDVEITLEANPGTVTRDSLKGFRNAGINRLSFGFQAAQEKLLQTLERDHDRQACDTAFLEARAAGFDNLSLDLMFGLPNQTMDDWSESLDWAIAHKPDHLSFYGLTIEPGTPFATLKKAGKMPVPGEDLQADMYLEGIRRLAGAGLAQYEISNFAIEGRQAVHNRLYWENQPTLGLGAGAWSFDGWRRWGRIRLPEKYIEKSVGGGTGLAGERLPEDEARGEAAMLGLRLLEGIDLAAWQQKHGETWHGRYGEITGILERKGLLVVENGRVRLTQIALPVADVVFSEFVGAAV